MGNVLCMRKWEAPGMAKDELKQALKEALKEWLDEKYSTFGRWSAAAIGAAALAALTYFIFWANGWRK
jgi:hypothetical protein